jgi:hypothetical protein
MGCTVSKNIYYDDTIISHFQQFANIKCIIGANEYVSYYELCFAFSQYTRKLNSMYIKEFIHKTTKRNIITNYDWSCFGMNVIDMLCTLPIGHPTRLNKIAFPMKNPIILGIKVIIAS